MDYCQINSIVSSIVSAIAYNVTLTESITHTILNIGSTFFPILLAPEDQDLFTFM